MPLATKNNKLIVKDGKIAENCGCCIPPVHMQLTMHGWQNMMHCYNTATSVNYVSANYDIYASINPAPLDFLRGYSRLRANFLWGGALCNESSFFCTRPLLWFSDDYVSVRISQTTSAGMVHGCTVEYRKARSGFWENKYGVGVYYFTPSDVVSFTTTSNQVSSSDVGSVAVVQRQMVNGSVMWLANEKLEFPIRVDLGGGVSEIPGPLDYATPGSLWFGEPYLGVYPGTVSANASLVSDIFGVEVTNAAVPYYAAFFQVSQGYWIAYSSGGSLTLQSAGGVYPPFPGVQTAFGLDAPPSTITISKT